MLLTRTVLALLVLPTLALAQMQSGGVTSDPSGKLPYVPQDDRFYTRERTRLVDQPGLIVTRLENGMTVIVKENRQLPVVAVRMYVLTGAIYEQEYLGTGISHLFEHLLAGGTTSRRTEAQIRLELDKLGGNTNAYTTIDHTCYYINTTAAGRQPAIDLVADWITRPLFPLNEFEREWGVVQRELDNGKNDPGRQFYYALMENVYDMHPARFPVIGHQQALQAITLDMIKNYYHRMYVPDNVVVSVCGDFKAEDALKDVQDSFQDFKRRPVVNVVLPDQPEPVSPRVVIRRLPEIPTATVGLSWLTVPLSHDDLYPLDLLSYILTQGRSSRLEAELVQKRRLLFSVDSSSYTPHWGKGHFTVSARCAPGKVEEALKAVPEQLERIVREGVTADELAQAKRQKLVEHYASRQEVEEIAADLAGSLMSAGDVFFSDAYTANIQKVTAEQVQAAAAKYLRPERLRTTLLLPQDAPLPALPQPSPGELGPWTKETLPNGLTVIIRRNTAVPMVYLSLLYKGGLLNESAGTNGLSNLTAGMLTRGTGTRSAEQIAQFFDRLGGGIGGQAGNNSVILSASCFKDDFAKALEVFADCALASTFPDEEIERLRPQILDAIKNQDVEPLGQAIRLLRLQHFTNAYRYLPIGQAGVVAKANSAALADWYTALRARSTPVLAIVGDVDPAKTLEQVKALFGSTGQGANAASQPASEPYSGPARKPGIYVKKTSKQVAAIAMAYPGARINEPETIADLTVLDTVISGFGLPGGWLHNSLRGLGGRNLVYMVHAVNQPQVEPGSFVVYALCQPDKAGEVLKIIENRIARAKFGAFSAEAWAANLAEVRSELPELLNSAAARPAAARGPADSQPAGGLPFVPASGLNDAVWTLLAKTLDGLKDEVTHEQAFDAGLDALKDPLTQLILKHRAGMGQVEAQTLALKIIALATQARQGFISDEELALAKGSVLANDTLDKQALGAQLQSAGLDELYGLGMDYSASLPARINAVTRERVIAAARKYLADPVIVICTPAPQLLGLPAGSYTLLEDAPPATQPAGAATQPATP